MFGKKKRSEENIQKLVDIVTRDLSLHEGRIKEIVFENEERLEERLSELEDKDFSTKYHQLANCIESLSGQQADIKSKLKEFDERTKNLATICNDASIEFEKLKVKISDLDFARELQRGQIGSLEKIESRHEELHFKNICDLHNDIDRLKEQIKDIRKSEIVRLKIRAQQVGLKGELSEQVSDELVIFLEKCLQELEK